MMSTTLEMKTGRIKYVDGSKNYGYVIEDGEPNPNITSLFVASVVENAALAKSGAAVEYWLKGECRNVQRLRVTNPAPGWTHEQAKTHTLVERLFERCGTYAASGLACPGQGTLAMEDWCERCLAAARLLELGDK